MNEINTLNATIKAQEGVVPKDNWEAALLYEQLIKTNGQVKHTSVQLSHYEALIKQSSKKKPIIKE